MTAIADRVLASAESWIGTPYRHQGSHKGVGCDCLGLVRGVWREIYGAEPEVFAPYAPDWAERAGQERLLEAAGRHFRPVAGLGEALPGDVLIFRWQAGSAAKHAGILAGAPCASAYHPVDPEGSSCAADRADPCLRPRSADDQNHFIHAYEQAAVIRSALVASWRRRVAGVFRFPEM
ncbi:MAG: NlpC/P60 family protein [Allorhizobium sp.]